MENKKKIKVLAFCDSPICHSGFAQVARNILGSMHEMGLEITVWGINHVLEFDEYGRQQGSKYPYEIIMSNYVTNEDIDKGYDINDVYGREKLVKFMHDNDFDIFWTMQDPYVFDGFIDKLTYLQKLQGNKFKTILYFPVDAAGIPKRWAEITNCFDYPVVYTEFGKERILNLLPEMENKLNVIYHGTNVEDFHPLPADQTKQIKQNLGFLEDEYLVLNVNRNQPRKDMARTLQVFAEFKKQVPKARLLMFCKNDDVGGNLKNRAKYYGLNPDEIFFPNFPKGADSKKGFNTEVVNQIYNIADVVISTSLGEGWGLSLTEAMACKKPVIFPNHSSITEIIGAEEERGFLVNAGSTDSEYIHLPAAVNDPVRPLTNVSHMLEKMLYVWNNKNNSKVLQKVDEAFIWVNNQTWNKIFEKNWKSLLEKIINNIK